MALTNPMRQSHFSDPNKWILDLGASNNMCGNKGLFTNLADKKTLVTLADNTQIEVIGEGQVHPQNRLPGGSKEIVLKKVLYIPMLRVNLVSIPRIVENKAKVEFSLKSTKITYLLTGEVIAIANKQDSLFVIQLCTKSVLYSSGETDSILDWHRKLGHLGLANNKIGRSIRRIMSKI